MAGKIVDILKYVIGVDTKDLKKGAKDADRKVKNMSAGIQRSLGGIAVAFAAAFGAHRLMGFVKNITLIAARNKELQVVLENVGRVAGHSAGFLAKQEEKIKALGITTQVARSILIRFMQAQLDVADATKIARAAQDLAVIAGQNTADAAATITQAIAAQRPILLKQYGILANLNDVYGRQAKLLGKSVDALTEFERRQAFVNIILEQAARVEGTYEAAMMTAGKQARSLSRYTEEASVAMGKKFQPAFAVGVQTLTHFYKGLTSLFDPLGVMVSHQVKLAKYVDDTEGGIDALVDRYVELSEKGVLVNEEQAEMNGLMVKLLSLLPTVRAEYDSMGRVVGLYADSLKRAAEQFKAMYEAEKKTLELQLPIKIRETKQTIDDTEASLNSLLGVVENQPESYDRWGSAITGLRIRLTKLREALIEYQRQLNLVRGTEEAGLGGDGETTEDTGAKAFADQTLKSRLWLLNQLRKYDKINEVEYLASLQRMLADTRYTEEQKALLRRALFVQLHDMEKTHAEGKKAIEQAGLDFIEQSNEKIAAGMAELNERLTEQLDEAAEKRREHWERVIAEQEAALGFLFAGYDTFWQSVLDLDMTGSERRKAIFNSMAQALIGYEADLLKRKIKGWLFEKTVVEGVEKTKLAAVSAGVAGRIALYMKEGAAALASAAKSIYSAVAKIFDAHSWMPFVGVGIAAGFVGYMMGQISAFKKFQTGGLVLGKQSDKDSVAAMLTPGEFVIRRPAVDAIGRRNLDRMNRTGQMPSQSTNVINVEMGGMSFSRMDKTDSFFIGTSVTDQVTEIVREAIRQGKLEL